MSKLEKDNGTGDVDEKLDNHPFTALFIILIIAYASSFFIPSGEYSRVVIEGRTVVDPDSFKYIEKVQPTFQDFFLSFYNGFGKVWGLIAMVFFIGGAFGVVKRIGLLEVSVKVLARKLKNAPFLLVAIIIMVLVMLVVSFTGVWELSMVIVPFIIPLCLGLGYDHMVGAGLVIIATCAGYGAALTNPFFTAVAHQIAELPLYSGMGYRALTTLIFFIISFIFIIYYARKVKADPTKSVMYGVETGYSEIVDDGSRFTAGHKRAGVAFILMFMFLIYGTVFKGFSFAEMSATFVAMGLLVGLISGASLNRVWHMFSDGIKDMMLAGLVIFFARSILFILEEAVVIDTIIHFLAQFLIGSNSVLTAGLMFVIQSFVNFIIPSGSGQAAITMPILIPLADMGGVNRQVACYASQMGDALSNFIWPTNGGLVALLSIAGIPYMKWFKFFAPLFGVLAVVAIILTMIAQVIDYGPF